MIRVLGKLIFKTDIASPQARTAYGILCGAVGIFLNLCLFAGKFIAGTITSSIAITADAFNNLSDAASSIITLIGFKIANQKPDSDHPFGHGRYEYIAGFVVSMFIVLMGWELLKESFVKILHPQSLTFRWISIIILVVSILVKLYMYYYNHTLGKKLQSSAMEATATDSLSDMVATAVVLLCTLASHFLKLHIDGYCGFVVGILICLAGFRAAKDTINPLLGEAPDKEFVKQIEALVMAHPEILGIHDLIVHNYGPNRLIISLHAEVPADGDILMLHDIIDGIEHELKSSLHCHAVIHMDPICNNDPLTQELKKFAVQIIKDIDNELSLHDFRIVTGPSHTNLIFDVVVPFGFPTGDQQLIDMINDKIREKHPSYFAVIEVDKRMA